MGTDRTGFPRDLALRRAGGYLVSEPGLARPADDGLAVVSYDLLLHLFSLLH